MALLRNAKAAGVEIAVLPEAFLTGYCVGSRSQAEQIAIPRTHDSIARLEEAIQDLGVIAVVGFAESDGGELYNSAVLLEPGREPRFVRKTHLPELGYDRFATAGDELALFETALGTVGVLICFDMRHSEAAKALALRGADLICLPTNWPVGAEVSAEHICIARAAENRVFFATCNRVGAENGFTFIGRSKLIGVTGNVLAAAGAEAEMIVADVDFAEARIKRTVTIPGEYETTLDVSRRPELYGVLCEQRSDGR